MGCGEPVERRFAAIGRVDVVALQSKSAAYGITQGCVVVDHQDPGGHDRASSSAPSRRFKRVAVNRW
jgi:hypothetical protein